MRAIVRLTWAFFPSSSANSETIRFLICRRRVASFLRHFHNPTLSDTKILFPSLNIFAFYSMIYCRELLLPEVFWWTHKSVATLSSFPPFSFSELIW